SRESNIESAAVGWSELVFVCSKCMKRQDREDLRGELKRALKHAGHRELRVVACGCLDLCPKEGVTIARGRDLAATPPLLRVLGVDDEIDDIVGWLLERE
ncbi:MAG: hypothetical protein WBP11_01570, partial [Dokdonella sp.]